MIVGTISEDRKQGILNCLEIIKKNNNTNPILEFGVFEGYSASIILNYMYNNNMQNELYGFDSFRGLPHDETVWRKGEFYSSYVNTICTLSDHVKNINQLVLVRGWFSDTLNDKTFKKYQFDKASLIHIDCDLYSSCTEVLSFVGQMLVKDTYIIFDEWPNGENRAWREFAYKNKIKFEKISKIETQMVIKIL